MDLMKDPMIMKKVGLYICMAIDAAFVLLAWFLSQQINGIPMELFTFFGVLTAGANALIKYIVQKYFGIDEIDYLEKKMSEIDN